MKSNKIIFATLIALLAVCALASVANAQSTQPTFNVSVSSSNHGVNEASTNTIVVTNTGTVNLVTANMTVPSSYSAVANVAVSPNSWNITYGDSGTGNVIINLATTGSGLANGQSLTVTFDSINPITAATYTWSTVAATSDGTQTTVTSDYAIVITTIVPALEILGIAALIAFANTGLNRVLINYFIGWEQYRVMQKEMAEHRTEQMAAARSGDQKRMEKLKKKQSQINNMQAKMMKPQMVQIGVSFVYIIVWFLVLIPVFGSTSMAYLPGFGPLPVVWLYPLFSLFLGLLTQRIIGVNPIEM
jgi:uncharacterized membrane protein (DUF106 family)